MSLALAVAVAVVGYFYSGMPPVGVQEPTFENGHNNPDWQNVTRKIGMRFGDSVYDLSVTWAGVKVSCFDAVDPERPQFTIGYLEHFYSFIVLFLLLPAAWLTRGQWRGAFLGAAGTEPAAMPPDHWQWAIKSLLVGILGFPVYVATVDLCASLTGPIAKASGLAQAIQLGFFMAFPPCCLAFTYKEQSRWRGNAVGEAGAFLTIVWFAFWVVLFLVSLTAL
jgi:hypothetical protein